MAIFYTPLFIALAVCVFVIGAQGKCTKNSQCSKDTFCCEEIQICCRNGFYCGAKECISIVRTVLPLVLLLIACFLISCWLYLRFRRSRHGRTYATIQ